jgi:hypothetical protein
MLEWFLPHAAGGQFVGGSIDRAVFQLDGLRPRRQQSPLHDDNFALADLGIEPDDWLDGLRRGVIRWGQFVLVENIGVMQSVKLACLGSISELHELTLLQTPFHCWEACVMSGRSQQNSAIKKVPSCLRGTSRLASIHHPDCQRQAGGVEMLELTSASPVCPR